MSVLCFEAFLHNTEMNSSWLSKFEKHDCFPYTSLAIIRIITKAVCNDKALLIC